MSNTPTSTLNTVSSSGESVQMTNQPGSTALPSSKRSNKRLLIGFGLLGPATFLSLGILGLKFLKRKKAGITLAPPDIPQSPITIDPTVTNPDNNFETENKE